MEHAARLKPVSDPIVTGSCTSDQRASHFSCERQDRDVFCLLSPLSLNLEIRVTLFFDDHF